MNDYLKKLDNKFDALARITSPGQAYFGGTGPSGQNCFQCQHWLFVDYYSGSNTRYANLLRPGPCGMYTKMMAGVIGPAVPPLSLSCNRFEKKDNAPPYRKV